MKKRSLVAAVAMLLVSAIMLTSATYAWFAASTAAHVGTISASVQKSDGSILVSGYSDKDETYTDELSQTALAAVTKTVNNEDVLVNTFPQYLKPVSFNKSNQTFSKVQMSGTMFTQVGLSNPMNEYVRFDFYVKSTIDVKADVSFTMTGNQNFVYGYATWGSGATAQEVLLGTTGRSYYPITSSAPAYAYDDNANFIVDNAQANTVLDLTGTAPTGYDTFGHKAVADDPETPEDETVAAGSNPITLAQNAVAVPSGTGVNGLQQTVTRYQLTANTPVKITVYMWAEGQDLACNGSQTASPSLDINIVKSANQT